MSIPLPISLSGAHTHAHKHTHALILHTWIRLRSLMLTSCNSAAAAVKLLSSSDSRRSFSGILSRRLSIVYSSCITPFPLPMCHFTSAHRCVCARNNSLRHGVEVGKGSGNHNSRPRTSQEDGAGRLRGGRRITSETTSKGSRAFWNQIERQLRSGPSFSSSWKRNRAFGSSSGFVSEPVTWRKKSTARLLSKEPHNRWKRDLL